MRVLHVETITHGRVLIEDAAGSCGWLIGFHGYGQAAESLFSELQRLNADGSWSIAAPQALHRFYTRGDERVVASWMTRQDRDLAVADNVRYVDSVLQIVGSQPVVFVGFSQGAAMAYRAAVLGRYDAAAVIALAGDVPPELQTLDANLLRRRLPRVLIGAGTSDDWYTAAKADADASWLARHDIPHEVIRFTGGHAWTDEFRDAVRAWLDARDLGRPIVSR